MEAEATCPYCGQPISIEVDEGGQHAQRYEEDCSVCCRPLDVEVHIHEDGEGVTLLLHREDD